MFSKKIVPFSILIFFILLLSLSILLIWRNFDNIPTLFHSTTLYLSRGKYGNIIYLESRKPPVLTVDMLELIADSLYIRGDSATALSYYTSLLSPTAPDRIREKIAILSDTPGSPAQKTATGISEDIKTGLKRIETNSKERGKYIAPNGGSAYNELPPEFQNFREEIIDW